MGAFCNSQPYETNPTSEPIATRKANPSQERTRVMLPSSINFEGFILSHDVERVAPLGDEAVKAFVGRPSFKRKLDPADPTTFGAIATHENYYEFRTQQLDAMERSLEVFKEVEAGYEAISGRRYGAVSAYNTETADYVVVVNGCTSGTMRAAARELNKEGGSFGVLAVKLFRPFPTLDVLNHLKGAKAVTVMDRSLSPGAPSGPLAEDVKSVLKGAGLDPPVVSIVYGIGGRDFSTTDAKKVFAMSEHAKATGSEPVLYGVRADVPAHQGAEGAPTGGAALAGPPALSRMRGLHRRAAGPAGGARRRGGGQRHRMPRGFDRPLSILRMEQAVDPFGLRERRRRGVGDRSRLQGPREAGRGDGAPHHSLRRRRRDLRHRAAGPFWGNREGSQVPLCLLRQRSLHEHRYTEVRRDAQERLDDHLARWLRKGGEGRGEEGPGGHRGGTPRPLCGHRFDLQLEGPDEQSQEGPGEGRPDLHPCARPPAQGAGGSTRPRP